MLVIKLEISFVACKKQKKSVLTKSLTCRSYYILRIVNSTVSCMNTTILTKFAILCYGSGIIVRWWEKSYLVQLAFKLICNSWQFTFCKNYSCTSTCVFERIALLVILSIFFEVCNG